MATTIRTEKHQRSFFGQIVKWVFIAFNVLMLVWLVSGFMSVAEMDVQTDAERAGQAIGTAIAVYVILGWWASGVIVLGILVLLTRGNKVIVEETVSGGAPGVGSFSDERTSDADAAIARYVQQQQERPVSSGAAMTARPAQKGFGRR